MVATLNGVVADDWATFLRDRLDGKVPLTGGIEASGWKLVYKDKPNAYAKAACRRTAAGRLPVFARLQRRQGRQVGDVRWDSPAFNAGIGSGMTWSRSTAGNTARNVLEDAVKAAKDRARRRSRCW